MLHAPWINSIFVPDEPGLLLIFRGQHSIFVLPCACRGAHFDDPGMGFLAMPLDSQPTRAYPGAQKTLYERRLAVVTLRVNGKTYQVDAEPGTPLLWVLRDSLGLTGTKYGCGIAQCGACTVHVDGRATRSCVVPLSAVLNNEITTIEGLAADSQHPVQRAWMNMTCRSAATASQARSWQQWLCWRRSPIPRTAISTVR